MQVTVPPWPGPGIPSEHFHHFNQTEASLVVVPIHARQHGPRAASLHENTGICTTLRGCATAGGCGPNTIQKPPYFYHAFSPSRLSSFFSSSHQLEYPRKPIVDPCRTFWVQQPLFTMPSPEEMFAPYEASATGRRPYRHLDPARSPFPLNRRVDPRFKKVPHPRLSDDARDLSALRLR